MPLLSFTAVLFAILVSVITANADDRVRFNRDVRPILSNNCFHCHGPDASHREADLRLDVADEAMADRGGYVAIQPGSLADSVAWQRIISDDEDEVMPPIDSHKTLSDADKQVLQDWIEQGAEFEGHWAFQAPVKPELPDVQNVRFAQHPIDRFVYRRIVEAGLEPSPAADRQILLRRVTLDLTGLPPTLAEIDEFINDTRPDAFERVVDRLLNSPHFGERMAVHWLDAARYGDTSVFHADGPRDMWVWRDWVVEAFNRNLPYDQFTIHQLAGDQLPSATWRELVATGFNRNNATTDEGGAIAEEFRVEYAVDRVKTTSMVWLGLSMECAQCHEHKYDPISQEDYYRFFAFFNQAADPGMQTRKGNQTPIVEVPDLRDQTMIPAVESELSELQNRLDQIGADAEAEFQSWLAKSSSKAPAAFGEISHWKLDRIKDGQLEDQVDSSRKGHVRGEAPLAKGRILQSLTTSAKQYAELPAGDFERDQAFSLAVWVYSDKPPAGAAVAKMNDKDAHRGYDLLLQPKGVAVHLIHQWPENAIKVQAATDLSPKTWHHLCVTYDGSGSATGIAIFHNGKLVEAKTETDQLRNTIRSETPLTVGRRTPGSTFAGRVDDLRIYDRALGANEVSQLATLDTVHELLGIDKKDRTQAQNEQLKVHYLTHEHAAYQAALVDQETLTQRLDELRQPLTTAMVMKDVDELRMTYVLQRGQYDAPDKQRPVQPNTPGMLPPLYADKSPPHDRSNRLALARWIVRRDNPLTARVAVNRFWRLLFGTGIVATVEEFGSQGDWPSHPELLDWLAVDFMQHDWDIKRLLKQIAMSETYRQSSRIRPAARQIDPENHRLARGARFRLSAEMVRDQALSCAGLLNPTLGGPSVKPYQPAGLWSEVSLNPGVKFVQDTGPALYRRSLYTYWKRSSPPPMMLIFDAPSREKCSVRRSNTNTPLQALVLMNDPQFLEAARGMAQRLLNQAELSDDERIVIAHRWVTGRVPDSTVHAILNNQLTHQRQRYHDDPTAAAKLLSHGESPRDESISAKEHAAWTILCSILLNLDETVTRG